MFKKPSKTAVYIGLVIIVGLAAFLLYKYTTSFQKITINYENAHDVKIYKDLVADGKSPSSTPIKKVAHSGETLRLKKGDYLIHYTGNPGYNSLFLSVSLSGKKESVSINPDYTTQKINSVLDKEFPTIKVVLKKAYPNISLYDIEKGRLYDKGLWYGTTLIYKNPNDENSDTLRVILKKQKGKWTIKTNPPNISLDKETYKDVPYGILDDVNSM